MNIPCAHCGAMLRRPPSRIAANAQQFCDFRCLGAHRARPVTLACAICEVPITVKASRAAQYNAITCGPPCTAELRRRTQIARHGSAERRVTTCAECGKTVTRKPSQIEKYPTTFCGRSCKARYMSGPRPEQMTGEWIPCEGCGKSVWRTPATKREHVFCSRECAHYTEYVGRICEHCGGSFEVIPSQADARFCSQECKWNAQVDGWMGEKNPLWKDGSSLIPYAPGFTPSLKKSILKRDKGVCRACGVSREQARLDIHHIDEGKDNHDPTNLITLCISCHQRVHHRSLPLPTI